MKEVAKSTRVVVTTAGPYAQFGNELVKACVTEGTHYADITGETLWMAEVRRRRCCLSWWWGPGS